MALIEFSSRVRGRLTSSGRGDNVRLDSIGELTYPRASVMGVIGIMALYGEMPNKEQIVDLKRFAGTSLTLVDNRGDKLNYPPHDRTFLDTVRYYHPEIAGIGSEFGINDWKSGLNKWLSEKKINTDPVLRWFDVNIVWEHLAGGGKTDDIPSELNNCLAIKSPVGDYGYPMRSLVTWNRLEEEERRLIYRMTTGWEYAHALACVGLGIERFRDTDKEKMDKARKLAVKIMGYMNVYQIHTDRMHKKGEGEPTWNGVVDAFKARDVTWGDRQESRLAASLSGISYPMWLMSDLATGALCAISGEKAEWD